METTTLATHLAGAWARWGSGPVLLADLAGGLGFRLDLSPTTPTWATLAPRVNVLDGGSLARSVASPWPDLAVLPLPGLPDGAPEQRPATDLVDAVLSAARGTFHTIVLDLPPSALTCGPAGSGPDPRQAAAAPPGGRADDGPATGIGPSPRADARAGAADAQAGYQDAFGLPETTPWTGTGEASFDPEEPAAAALGAADVLLMVARPDSAGLTALETADTIRAAAGMPVSRAGMVVVGGGAAAPVAPREVRARLGDRLWALVPSSAAELAAAAEDGLLLLDRPEVPAVQAMLALAHRVVPFTGVAVGR